MGVIDSIRLGSLASLVAVTIAGSPRLAQQPKKPNGACRKCIGV